MRAHNIPMPLFWALQAGRAKHQQVAWFNLAREYKDGHKRYDHCLRYARIAHREYQRLLKLSVESYFQQFSNMMVDTAAEDMKELPRNSGPTLQS